MQKKVRGDHVPGFFFFAKPERYKRIVYYSDDIGCGSVDLNSLINRKLFLLIELLLDSVQFFIMELFY